MFKPLDVPGLAEFLGISESWIRKQAAARLIPHSRVARQIRFTEEHVQQILAAGEEPITVAPVVGMRSRRQARVPRQRAA